MLRISKDKGHYILESEVEQADVTIKAFIIIETAPLVVAARPSVALKETAMRAEVWRSLAGAVGGAILVIVPNKFLIFLQEASLLGGLPEM